MTGANPEVEPAVHYQIEGGAGPSEAAAIVAAVSQVLTEQLLALAIPPTRPEQNKWVAAWQPQPVEPPIRSHSARYIGAWRVSAGEEKEEPSE